MEKSIHAAFGKAAHLRHFAVNMLWIGPKLGRLEQLSIRSFLAAGHEVRLHSYEAVENVPAGVVTCDAAKTLPYPEAVALRHRQTGSFALASDLFRYRLMIAQEGVWSDTDVVCMRPLKFDGGHVFGWESSRRINGAVLLLPKDSPILLDLLRAFQPNFIPPWLSLKRKAPFFWRRMKGRDFGPADLPWGTFGPRALTYLARKHGLEREAKAQSAFYPVPLRDARRIFDADFTSRQANLTDSFTVHLWNERLKDIKDLPPAPGSLLDLWYSKFGV